jgi:hypothetical protein
VWFGPPRTDVNHYLKWVFVEAANSICLHHHYRSYCLVTARTYSDALITDHANEQMRRRGTGIDFVRSILRNPEQVIDVRPGRVVLQSRVDSDNRSQLVRVFLDVDESPVLVVTVHRTINIDKYWSRP